MIGLTGCVVIQLPATENTHTSDVHVKLLQPFEWELNLSPPTVVVESESSSCVLPPLPTPLAMPSLNIVTSESALSPIEVEDIMINYIEELHTYIQDYKDDMLDHQYLLQSRCGGGDTQ
jgi:hypothetical protein